LLACSAGEQDSEICAGEVCLQAVYVWNFRGTPLLWAEMVTPQGEPIAECPEKGLLVWQIEHERPSRDEIIQLSSAFRCNAENILSSDLPFASGEIRSALIGVVDPALRVGVEEFAAQVGTAQTIEIMVPDQVGSYIYEYQAPEPGEFSMATFVEISTVYPWPDPVPALNQADCLILPENLSRYGEVGHFICFAGITPELPIPEDNDDLSYYDLTWYDLTEICQRYPDTQQCAWLP
jgi:hypothetical protein